MKHNILILFCLANLLTYTVNSQNVDPFVALSMEYLENLQDNSSTTQVLQELQNVSIDELQENLSSKAEKLAFWINIYNAHVISLLREDASYFDDKDQFYKERDICIAGLNMSLDEIEHGILRDSRVKWSLGYLQKWFVPSWIKKLRNKNIDGRVHFALNCGAQDCPPVGIYNDVDIYDQLDYMTNKYLTSKTIIEGNEVKTSPLFSWFRGDFGGKKGIKKFLVKHNILEDCKNVNLSFANYDWTMKIGEIKDIPLD